jgi:hypothetical protein
MYRGEAKTDARDAAVIADQARMRRDLQQLTPADPSAADLRVLTAHRLDLAADRTRAINRLRQQLLSYFPALERAFDYRRSKGALTLLTGFRTPARIRELGESRLVSWLKTTTCTSPRGSGPPRSRRRRSSSQCCRVRRWARRWCAGRRARSSGSTKSWPSSTC